MWIKHLMTSCRKATKLIEKRELAPLRPAESFQLRIHLFACKYCTEYHKQNDLINDMITDSNLKNSQGIDPAFKAKMQALIDSNILKQE